MRYSLNKIEHRNFKARITERLVEKHIKEISIPQLRKEGFDLVIFDRLRGFQFTGIPIPLSSFSLLSWLSLLGAEDTKLEELYNTTPDYRTINGDYHLQHDMDEEERRKTVIERWKKVGRCRADSIHAKVNTFYLKQGVMPHPEFYLKTIELIALLQVATDGLLFKMKKTGKMIPKSDILHILKNIKEATSDSYIEESDIPENIPVASGEIEIVEVKADKASIPPHQRQNYKFAIERGYPLRYFHVFIISFENNHFEVEERILENADDLKETIRLFMKIARDRNTSR